MSNYLKQFGSLPATATINPYEPGKCAKFVCQNPATVTLADNSRAQRYCDAHAEHVVRTMEWFPIASYTVPLRVEQ